MKQRMFVVLVVFCALALAALGQQSSSNAGSQPTASGAASSAASPSANADEKLPPPPSDFWEGDEPNIVNLISHPFATKKYVQRHVAPIRDRINELDQITDSNAKLIKDVDARAQHGIQLASDKASLADQHAGDAGNRADAAKLSATQATTRVATTEQRVANLDQYKTSAQTEIRFHAGQNVLSKEAKDALDQMAAPLKDQRSYIIEVQGFAPGRGQAAIAASQTMADSVVRYLVLNHQIPVYRVFVLSMGDEPVAAEGGKRITAGRVEVNLLTNDALSAQR